MFILFMVTKLLWKGNLALKQDQCLPMIIKRMEFNFIYQSQLLRLLEMERMQHKSSLMMELKQMQIWLQLEQVLCLQLLSLRVQLSNWIIKVQYYVIQNFNQVIRISLLLVIILLSPMDQNKHNIGLIITLPLWIKVQLLL